MVAPLQISADPVHAISGHRGKSLALAALLTFLLFLALPLSRFLSPPVEEPSAPAHRVRVLTPPPPPPPPPEISRPESARQDVTPRLDLPVNQVPTHRLAIDLSYTVETRLTETIPLGMLGTGEGIGDAIRRFTFADLLGGPRLRSIPPVSIPVNLSRRGFRSGRVTFSIRINEDGTVEVFDVVSATHQELIEPARRSAARARFEPPEVNGVPTPVYGHWPLNIESF